MYEAFQGEYASGFFGGTEYFDDILPDSTNAAGEFKLQIPVEKIDSFGGEHISIFSLYRFALDVRSVGSNNYWDLYRNYNVLSAAIDSESNLV